MMTDDTTKNIECKVARGLITKKVDLDAPNVSEQLVMYVLRKTVRAQI